MTTFYICRHGETRNNRDRRLSGWADTPLTEEGVKNAAASAQKLNGIRFDKIISSNLGRAVATAEIIAKVIGYRGEIKRLHALREVNYGDLANQPYEAYPPGLTPLENATLVHPKGESLAQMQQRVLAYLQAESSSNDGKTILIVAHDGTINAVRASFDNENIGIADGVHNPHDFVARFTMEADKITSFAEV